MRTIAHISDLHFGRDDPSVAAALQADIRSQAPDVLVVSGDLTQRARRREFRACRAYLDGFPVPRVVVPGNHDIPLYDVVRRFLFPWRRFKRFIHPEATPTYEDAELSIVGLSTARSSLWANGRISRWQLAALRRHWSRAEPTAVRLLVTHHPFLPTPQRPRTQIVGRAPLALEALVAAGADLLLCGHHHVGFTGDLREHHQVKRSILVAQAGTALSVRRRGEPNSYNVIRLDGETAEIRVRAWDGARFASSTQRQYDRTPTGWVRRGAAAPRLQEPFAGGELPQAAP